MEVVVASNPEEEAASEAVAEVVEAEVSAAAVEVVEVEVVVALACPSRRLLIFSLTTAHSDRTLASRSLVLAYPGASSRAFSRL